MGLNDMQNSRNTNKIVRNAIARLDNEYYKGIPSNYLGYLLADFDGENDTEKNANVKFGHKAMYFTEDLTPMEIFRISFLIERMQFVKFGNGDWLERIRLGIMHNLRVD